MSPTRYLILAALGLGALAIDSGAAEASGTNTTVAWCKARSTTDQVIADNGHASLLWKPDGDLVLQPTNHFVSKIWSTGTGGAGDKICWETDGTLAIYNTAGTKLWSKGGGTVPDPGSGTTYKYHLYPSLMNCDLSAKYSMKLGVPTTNGGNLWVPAGSGNLWTRAAACPAPSQSLAADDWCLDAPPEGHERTILQTGLSELVWTSGGTLVHRGRGIAADRVIWASENGAGNRLCFAPSGKLSIVDEAGMAHWSTPADVSSTSSHLLALEDCDIGVRRADGLTVWKDTHRCPQTTVSRGVQWTAGPSDVVILESLQAKLVFQADGNLVLRSAAGDEVWHSGLAAHRGKRLAFQTDGNLVIYDAYDQPAWGAKAWGQGITLLELDGCMFSLKTPTQTKWSRGAATCPSATLANSWSSVSSGSLTLLRTPEARLVWQGDGNLVLRTTGGKALWSTGTSGSGRTLVFFDHGSLVVHDAAGSPLWSTYTWEEQPVQRRLRLGDHCKLTLEDLSGQVQWTGNDSCTVVNYSFERAEGNRTFGVTLHTHLTATAGTNPRLDSDTGIDATIFGKRIELFSATASQTKVGGSIQNDHSLSILGVDGPLPVVNVTYEQTFFEWSKTYMVGPVPVLVSAGVTGELGLSLAFSGGTMKLTPTAGVYATVSAGVGSECDVGGASAGIRGQLTLIELGLPISLKLYLDGGQPKYTVRGDLTLGSLSGVLELYAEAYVKLLVAKVSAEWSYELFSWEGIEWYSKNLFSKSGTF